MNSTDPKSDIETEQLPRQQKELQTTSNIIEPVVFPDLKREETASSFPGTSENVLVEPVAQNFSELSYVCLLIPRFSDHYLIGDITEDLVEWMKQVCISYGWRLDAISARPG